MKSFTQFKREAFKKSPALKKAYDDLEPEYRIIGLMIRRRIDQGLTHAQLISQLSKESGIKQSAISRFESGRDNPTPEFLRNMANALGAEIKFSITPRS